MRPRRAAGSMAESGKIRVLLVDDHPVLRKGLTQLIQQQPDMEVCGEAGGVNDALRLTRSTHPHIVVIDMWLEDGHGLDLIKDLKADGSPPKMLCLTMLDETTYAERALRAGAHGFLSKSEAADEIINAIRQILRGEVFLNRRMTNTLLHRMVGGGAGEVRTTEDLLSDRELQVFELLGQGLTSRAISRKLLLSIKTVDTYREHIKEKLGVATANELVLRAVLWANRERGNPGTAADMRSGQIDPETQQPNVGA
jgi:DNA-binding NarL/FixJ family response regulator